MGVKQNIVANYLGRTWVALSSFLFIPIYIHYLGLESYGIIGFLASLMSALALLDFGMAQTLVREAARTPDSGPGRIEFAELLGSLEYVYWGMGLLAALVIGILSNWLAGEWLNAKDISHSDLAFVVRVMGVVAATRWAASPYRSALIGLQNQVWLNVFDGLSTAVRGLGSVAILALVSDTVLAFFAFQGLVSVVELGVLRFKAWRTISGKGVVVTAFRFHQLRRIGKFAGGVAAISLLGSGISMMDKLLLPGLLPLRVFGYYMVAQVLGRSITTLMGPVATAYRPLFAKLVASKQEAELSRQYHKASQVMAFSLAPAAIVIAVFSQQILWLWTGNREIANQGAILTSLISLGTMLNGLVNIAYSVQLAYGYLKLALIVNTVSAIVLMPAFYFGVNAYGVIAAGWVWFLLNAGYVLINVSVMHRTYLVGHARAWYFQDILPIVLGACGAAVAIRYLLPAFDSKWWIASTVVAAGIAAFAAAGAMSGHVRDFAIRNVRAFGWTRK
jgi:O-antigen/teichoic acid export membrane protein